MKLYPYGLPSTEGSLIYQHTWQVCAYLLLQFLVQVKLQLPHPVNRVTKLNSVSLRCSDEHVSVQC